MEAVTARAFMGNSSPELFVTLTIPIMRRLAWTSGSIALALARKLLSVKGRFLRSLYAEYQLSTRRITRIPTIPAITLLIQTRDIGQVALVRCFNGPGC